MTLGIGPELLFENIQAWAVLIAQSKDFCHGWPLVSQFANTPAGSRMTGARFHWSGAAASSLSRSACTAGLSRFGWNVVAPLKLNVLPGRPAFLSATGPPPPSS